MAQPPRTFYRLVQTDPPTVRDFLSYEALGIQPRRPLTARQRDEWQGISHYATQDAARIRARTSPHLGSFIATVRIPSQSARVEQRGRDVDHYTIWAEPATLLSWVVSIIPVERVQ